LKPPPFLYVRPRSIDEALEVLAAHGDNAKVLAGGQSLVPLLNFRLIHPEVVVDLGNIEGLDLVDSEDGHLVLGAMARQSVVEAAPVVRRLCPLLPKALAHVGHQQIRNRGTIGGSIAHADPAAELPAILLVLEASVTAKCSTGSRTIAAADVFVGPFNTSLANDELITEIRIPTHGIEGSAFAEVARRRGDFALAGVAAVRVHGMTRLTALGVGWTPLRLAQAEAELIKSSNMGEGIANAAAVARSEVSPLSDIHADAEYRRDAVAALVRRTLHELLA
jgi:carbon-monoxide dehydrogenase medium subunit